MSKNKTKVRRNGGKNGLWIQNHDLLHGKAEFSDFELHCGGNTFKVHKVILASQSPALEKACFGNFKESEQSFMDMLDDDPTAVSLMTYGIYGLDYDDKVDISGNAINPIISNVRVYLISDKYGVEAVRAISADKFKNLVESVPKTEEMWTLLAEALMFIYGNTHPPPIRDLKAIILSLLGANFTDFCSNPSCRALLDTESGIPDLCRDLLARVLQDLSPNCFSCSVCGISFGVLMIAKASSYTADELRCPVCKKSKKLSLKRDPFWSNDSDETKRSDGSDENKGSDGSDDNKGSDGSDDDEDSDESGDSEDSDESNDDSEDSEGN